MQCGAVSGKGRHRRHRSTAQWQPVQAGLVKAGHYRTGNVAYPRNVGYKRNETDKITRIPWHMCAGDFYGRIEQRKFTGLINPEVGGSNPSPATWQWYRPDTGFACFKGDTYHAV